MCHWLWERQWVDTGKTVLKEWRLKNGEEAAVAAWINGKLCYLVKHLVKCGNLEYRKYTKLAFIFELRYCQTER